PLNVLNDYHPLNEGQKIVIRPPGSLEKKVEDGITFFKSQWDEKWYPEKFEDYLRIHQIVKIRLQGEDPTNFGTFKDKNNKRSRY
ncbi:hypothetical protein ACXWO4_10375, partial [Streptococcus pyogenes]